MCCLCVAKDEATASFHSFITFCVYDFWLRVHFYSRKIKINHHGQPKVIHLSDVFILEPTAIAKGVHLLAHGRGRVKEKERQSRPHNGPRVVPHMRKQQWFSRQKEKEPWITTKKRFFFTKSLVLFNTIVQSPGEGAILHRGQKDLYHCGNSWETLEDEKWEIRKYITSINASDSFS